MFILHTANLYLDKPFTSYSNPHYGKERRRLQKELLDVIINKVFEHKANLLLITGNLFDAECITEPTLQYVCEKLESIQPVPVVIVPGETDPLSECSPYRLQDFPDNVFILDSEEGKNKWESQHEPLVVYTAKAEDIKSENFSAMGVPDAPDGRNHILALYEVPVDTHEELSRWLEKLTQPISYIALGKGHSFKQWSNSRLTLCRCGIPDPICFQDTPPYGILGIQFQDYNNRWEVSKIEHISTQKVSYLILNINVSTLSSPDEFQTQLRTELNRIQKPCVVHVYLDGIISTDLLRSMYENMEPFQKAILSFTWSLKGEIERYETSGDMSQTTVLSEYFRQMAEEEKYAPRPELGAIAKRARQLTVQIAEGIPIQIPAIETCEVPLEWNL